MSGIKLSRPVYHYTSPFGWINDPNGLIYHNGIFHIFYQHYPESINWGPMHWGHTITKDFRTYETRPIALYPDKNGTIYSGSIVEDINNSAGFGDHALVAAFTYHKDTEECQGLAYSLDDGETFTKYEDNPVIRIPNAKDFRDPKVLWHKETSMWIMLTVAYDRVLFYTSDNLRNWVKTGEFIPKEAFTGVLECPDMFKLQTVEEEFFYVLTVSIGDPTYGTKCYIGQFDGKVFKTVQKGYQWLDLGMDYYAAVTFNGINSDAKKVLAIGWQSNWLYAKDIPADSWRGVLSIPRTYELCKKNNQLLIQQKPADEINALFGTVTLFNTVSKIEIIDSSAKVTIPIKDNETLGITLNYGRHEVYIKLDKILGTLEIDRENTGFDDVKYKQKIMKYLLDNESVDLLTLYLDYNVLDLFLSDGSSMTLQVITDDDVQYIQCKGQTNPMVQIAYLEQAII